MAEWTHRVCETCWSGKYGLDEETGTVLAPSQMRDIKPAPCCECGELCFITGIFVRADGTTMKCQGDHVSPWPWSPVIGRVR